MLCSSKKAVGKMKSCEDDFVKSQIQQYSVMIDLMESILKSFRNMNLGNNDLGEFKQKFAKKEAPEIKRLALCASNMCAKSEELRRLHKEDMKVKKQLRQKMSNVKTVEEIMRYANEGLKHEKNMKKLRTGTKYLKCQVQKCAKEVAALEQKKKTIVGNTEKATKLKNVLENQGFKNFLGKLFAEAKGNLSQSNVKKIFK